MFWHPDGKIKRPKHEHCQNYSVGQKMPFTWCKRKNINTSVAKKNDSSHAITTLHGRFKAQKSAEAGVDSVWDAPKRGGRWF